MINLYSDTQTRPSEGMRRAMYEAEVADEQRRIDPTVNQLQERVAELLGKEEALFLPSGTMCNAIAFRLHIDKGGDEAILHEQAHPIIAEAGGPAAISGAMMKPLAADGGIFSAEQVEQAIRPVDRYMPRSRLVSVEQTTNMGGGRVWPQETLRAVVDVARRHDLRTHMDGARLMNAVVASGVPAARHADGFDTVWVDFTKGLGAGVGACLAASGELIEQAWRYKQMWGGSMRQAGSIAAACLYALDNNVERLADDHENARILADGLAQIPGVEIDPASVETNIVIFGVQDPEGLIAALAGEVELSGPVGPDKVRAVTHLDVNRPDIERALAKIAAALER
ncbi:MAG TPA: GntG family PLP-dependent aldolase [Thermoleophilaceae bacterium]|nr:GntG family PLP-dependent aldolase [Thermoleophilaceae bacterium]